MDWNRDSISAIMSCGGSNMEAEPEPEWNWAEEKTFENALVTFSEDSPDRWENITRLLPGKSLADILVHYEILVEDVAAIEAGDVEVPDYTEFPEAGPSRSNRSLCERKKSESWTVEEHKCFLQGVEAFGKSDWRNICRHFLKGRSPAQVSSHAQKFFIRQAAKKKDGMRASIHDLATISECDAILEGRLKLNDATTASTVVTDASATPSPSFDASPFSQGRSNDAAIAAANVVNDAYARSSSSLNIISDFYPFSQGRSNDFSPAAATAMAVTDVYARPSPSFIDFDDSNFSQGRFDDFSTAATVVTDASATPSPSSISASPFSQGRSNDAAIAIATANVVNDADAYPFFSQGRSNDFSTAAATAMAVTDVYARPSPNFMPFDDSPFFQGRSNDDASSIADAYARPTPSLINFDDSPFSQGRSNNVATTAVTDAYARPSPSLINFDDSNFSQGKWNDAATATSVADGYARPSPSLINFDAPAFSQGRWNDAAYTTAAVADAYARASPSVINFDAPAFSRGRWNDAAYFDSSVADAYARASPSLIIFDDAASSQGRGQESSPFNFK